MIKLAMKSQQVIDHSLVARTTTPTLTGSEKVQKHLNYLVFPKVDHSANIARVVLVEYTIGSVIG